MRRSILLAATSAAVLIPAAADATETITYSYDARGRLVQVSHSGTVNNGVTTTYTYDHANNRTNKTTTGAP
jgi:YD repeat-containing protein